MKRIAISIGDLNGIGIELALRYHNHIKEIVHPLYAIDEVMLQQAAQLLKLTIPNDFKTISPDAEIFEIIPATISAKSGAYSYASFTKAVALAKEGEVDALVTLPIHKKAWELAGIEYKGHTDALRDFFQAEAIMMLGCKEMFVALYTEHIPLKDVAGSINERDLTRFLIDFYTAIEPDKRVAVLGLNPHAGDDGVLGDEEQIIRQAIVQAEKHIGKSIFSEPLVPDIAFTPRVRANYTHYIAMYHDQGLTPLKALYFDEGINISLNLPILRTSVDHGTAFDIAYKGVELSGLSYLNAVRYCVE
jgi:4-hydroxythreonine-4-phosphate dehydrogenase